MDTPGEDFQAIGPDTWERTITVRTIDGLIAEAVATVDVEGHLWLSLIHHSWPNVVSLPLTPGEGAEIASAVWTASTYAARLRRAHGEAGRPSGADSGA